MMALVQGVDLPDEDQEDMGGDDLPEELFEMERRHAEKLRAQGIDGDNVEAIQGIGYVKS